MFHALSALQAAEDIGLFGKAVRWNENSDRFANNLTGFVAEQLLGTAIPAPDDAIQVFAYDRVVG